MSSLVRYAAALTRRSGKTFQSGEIFAKILSPNDDSGRHGVLVPIEAYSFFPKFRISDPEQNQTKEFPAFDAVTGEKKMLAYKFYERYPERRITRLNAEINERNRGSRLLIFIRALHTDGSSAYYFDCTTGLKKTFSTIRKSIFGRSVRVAPGVFVVRPVDSRAFVPDAKLAQLLSKFDRVRRRGWVNSLRPGDTGIGYTFERLVGIKENNDRIADYQGIEIKCKRLSLGGASATGKINLFQSAPSWVQGGSAKENIRLVGTRGKDGLYDCYMQVTSRENARGFRLSVRDANSEIDLRRKSGRIAYWKQSELQRRLIEKHSRAVFVKAKVNPRGGQEKFLYSELLYCERPNMPRFLNLVRDRNIVFEFTMNEKADGTIRNHGYPWRLVREEFLDKLFSFRIKLR